MDFKTPAKSSKTWGLQAAAYWYLANKSGYEIHEIEFVQLSKNGKHPIIHRYIQNIESYWEMYLKCLSVYKYFFRNALGENPLDYM